MKDSTDDLDAIDHRDDLPRADRPLHEKVAAVTPTGPFVVMRGRLDVGFTVDVRGARDGAPAYSRDFPPGPDGCRVALDFATAASCCAFADEARGSRAPGLFP